MFKKVFSICFCSFLLTQAVVSQAQTKGKTSTTTTNSNPTAKKTDLQARRQELLNQIKETQALLLETQQSQTVTLTQLRALNSKLDARKKLISNMSTEVNQLATGITSTQKEIEKLRAQVGNLKTQYARSIRYAYKHQESENMMAFVFSANTFNDMLRRMEYMKKYREYRKLQAEKIRHTQEALEKKVGLLNERKQKRVSLLSAQEQQKQAIENDAKQTEIVAQQLKSQEKDLNKQISKDRVAAIQLESAIKEQIRIEVEIARKKAEEEARQRAAAEAKKRAEEEARQRAIAQAKAEADAKERAAAEEKRRLEEAEKKLAEAKRKAAEDAERLRLKNEEDARRRREEAAAEEKRIADAAERERQRLKNEERNRQIDKIKEQERQKAEAEQKRKQQELEAQTDKIRREYKSERQMVSLATGSGGNGNSGSSARPVAPDVPTVSTPSTSSSSDYKYTLAPEAQNLSNNFEANKGRLPWPVDKGFIAAPYGNYKHPLEKSVTLNNSGIDIATSAGAAVKAIHAGVVTKIFNVPGMGTTVLISHGAYYTVYSRLGGTSVSIGSKVTARQTIGTVGTTDDGEHMVHLEVWKVGANNSISNTNPASWIAPR